jgi:hypothetical protein
MAAAGDARDDLLLLERYRSGADAEWAGTVRGIVARGEATSLRQLAVTGNDLLALGIPPGPSIGLLLERLLALVLEDPARNTPERLQEAARAWQ